MSRSNAESAELCLAGVSEFFMQIIEVDISAYGPTLMTARPYSTSIHPAQVRQQAFGGPQIRGVVSFRELLKDRLQ